MIPTLKLSDILTKWREAIQASQPIQNYCVAKYGTAPKLYIGMNGKQLPADSDCPFIVLYPGAKSEGLELQEYTYTLTVGWTILQSATTADNATTEYLGVAECDDLGQLIYLELAYLSTDNPISAVDYSIEPVAYYPRFPGRMDITLKITSVNGYDIIY
ncbi:MAG: hypothetical protein E6X17_09795 [Sporomusaceae bacterium]|nr:hypothetical protein [Sporomusaceae bacterium]